MSVLFAFRCEWAVLSEVGIPVLQGREQSTSTGLLGVSKCKHRDGFLAQIRVNRQTKSLGFFGTAEQAHAAYLAAKSKLHKESDLANYTLRKEAPTIAFLETPNAIVSGLPRKGE